jgi:hypothetical protein
MDWFYLALTTGFFVLTALLVGWFETMRRPG